MADGASSLSRSLVLLKKGRLLFGESEIPFGAAPDTEFEKILSSLRGPDRTWKDCEWDCRAYALRSDILWFRKAQVELSFRKDLEYELFSVRISDPECGSFRTDHFSQTRQRMQELFGEPKMVIEVLSSLKITWSLGPVEFTLALESSAPEGYASLVQSRGVAKSSPVLANAVRKKALRFAETPPRDVSSSRVADAWEWVLEEGDGSDQFGGMPPALAVSGGWPVCRRCREPMLFLAWFWNHPQRLSLTGIEAVAVFMCGNEKTVGECETWAPDSGANVVVLVRKADLLRQPPAVPSAFPNPLAMQRIRYLPCAAPQDEDDPVISRFGSSPDWVQAPENPRCSRCEATMRFLGQIDSSLDEGLNFGDAGTGYLFLCPKEHEGGFLWQCT